MKKAKNLTVAFKDKDKFSPPRSDHQTMNLYSISNQNASTVECSVKEEVIKIFCVGSTERTLVQIT